MNVDTQMFKCNVCSSTFYQKKYLAKHVKRMHSNEAKDQSVTSTEINIKCREDNCNENFRYLHELRSHLESTHNFEDINSCQKLTFPSKSEFLKWLADEEKKTNSKYVIASSEKKCRDHTYTIFNCNRSGAFKSQAKINKKQLKSQGSVRIGHHCTSSIIKKEYESHIEISYFGQHYKHIRQLKYIPIPQEEINELTLLNYHEQNKQKLFSLCSQISIIPNMDDNRAKQIRQHLNAIDHLLKNPTAQEPKLTLNEKTNEPRNKKITKQKRFHSTKQPKSTKKPGLSKQSSVERELKKSILLSPEFISSDRNNDHSYC